MLRDVDRHIPARAQGDRVTGPGVEIDHLRAVVQVDAGEEGVVAQVDDLEEIGDLEGYINRSSTVLIFCSQGYFTSKNCMRELLRAVRAHGQIDPIYLSWPLPPAVPPLAT